MEPSEQEEVKKPKKKQKTWTEARMRRVVESFENQPEDEAIADIERFFAVEKRAAKKAAFKRTPAKSGSPKTIAPIAAKSAVKESRAKYPGNKSSTEKSRRK